MRADYSKPEAGDDVDKPPHINHGNFPRKSPRSGRRPTLKNYSKHSKTIRYADLCTGDAQGSCVPVKIEDAPHRRMRVRFVYVVTGAPRAARS